MHAESIKIPFKRFTENVTLIVVRRVDFPNHFMITQIESYASGVLVKPLRSSPIFYLGG